MTELLVAQNLWRFFGRVPAVKGLDLVVERGSAYGFIGPNGAGKSTTLRMLATVDRPDAGRVVIQGLDSQRHSDRVRRLLGFMPDPFELNDELSVEDYLDFFGMAYRIPRQERRQRIDQVIDLTRIGPRRHQRCGALSKGWRQRVLLAKTLVHDPAVLLLDEPAAGLDPAARIEFREIVRVLRDLGKTIVVSSHILTELAGFCDSVGIIEKGRMLVSGKIGDILSRLNPTDQLEIELACPPGEDSAAARASALLTARPEIEQVLETGAEPPTTLLIAKLHGRSQALDRAATLATLVGAGLPVSRLDVRREGLEDLFLRVAGKLDDSNPAMSPETLRALLGEGDPA